MKTFNMQGPKALLLCLLFSATSFPYLQAQIKGENLSYNTPSVFHSTYSFFYYNSLPSNESSNAALMAATVNPIDSVGSMVLYPTLEEVVYVVGNGEDIYISPTLEELVAMVPDEVDTNFTVSVTIQGREADATNFLALYFSQLQINSGEDRIVYVEGIGTSMILDIDPRMSRTLEIPNNEVFSLTTTKGDCKSVNDFYQLTISY